jgi:hypothetical protein
MKYESDSNAEPRPMHDAASSDWLELPVPTHPLHSWSGSVDPDAVIELSESQLARFWSNPLFVKRRDDCRVVAEFKL